MKPKFDKAFKDMAALEAGAIANPDEHRMVGHYWLRNPDLAPTSELKQEIVETLQQIESFVKKVKSRDIKPPFAPQFTDIISIGIGGSALGPQFVAEALSPDIPPLAIHFIDNTDPAGTDPVNEQACEWRADCRCRCSNGMAGHDLRPAPAELLLKRGNEQAAGIGDDRRYRHACEGCQHYRPVLPPFCGDVALDP